MTSYSAPLAGGLSYETLITQGAVSNASAGNEIIAIKIIQANENGGLILQLEADNSANAHLLSLAGGGIKAMAADAGLLAGLLKYFNSKHVPTTIGDLLSKTTAISANSGSSWFIDLLGYSDNFVDSLQDYDTFFDSTGYMGKLETAYYNYATPPSNDINKIIVAILNDVGDVAGMSLSQLYGLLDNSSNNWNNFLSAVIFEPYDAAQLLQSVNFHADQSQRTDSLPNQSLIFQTSLSSNDAAINKFASEFGVVTDETVYTITNAGADNSGNVYIFIPAVITSLGSATDISAPTFPSLSNGSLDVTYSTYDSDSSAYAVTVLTNLNFDGLSAFLATSASSAAVSAVASGGVYDTGGVKDITADVPDFLLSLLLNEVQNISPLIQISDVNGTLIASDPAVGILDGDTTPAFLVTQGNSLLRLADGAYIDNTSVTSGLTYLQANNLLSNFTATALTFFDSADPNLVKINPGYANIGNEASVLFTGSDQNQTYSIVNVSHPSAAVFDATKTTGLDEPVWHYIGSAGFKLDYFKLGVTTAANSIGIAAGEHGTLNLWVVTTTAEALPSLNQTSWMQYSNLYNQMIIGLQSEDNGYTGAHFLASSLGLDTDFGFVIEATPVGTQIETQYLGGLLL